MTISLTTTDMHTAGEPLRIITGGLPGIQGNTVLERRRSFRDHYDHIRTGLMWEPRGHADMYGVILTPPNDPGADFGAFFLHNEGYSTMCGHAVIALARFAYEKGLVNKPEMIIDVPAGRINASVILDHGSVAGSSFQNVPSFVYLNNGEIFLEKIGNLRIDIAFGGAFYAFVNADDLKLKMIPSQSTDFIDLGRKIKKAVIEKYSVKHPFEADLSFLYGTIFTGKPKNPVNHSRNVCIFADGELDRSPTGTGVSARAALHFAKNELRTRERITIESIIGTTMDVEIAETTTFGPYQAVIPKVSGHAYYTGEHKFVFEENDNLGHGFLLR
jgi:proline racemase